MTALSTKQTTEKATNANEGNELEEEDERSHSTLFTINRGKCVHTRFKSLGMGN